MNPHILEIAKRKAQKSSCTFKVSAIALSHKDEVLGVTCNTHRFSRKGGGTHAETRLIERYGNNIKTIIICRVGKSGTLLPIDPCENCSKVARDYGIKIISLPKNRKGDKKNDRNVLE